MVYGGIGGAGGVRSGRREGSRGEEMSVWVAEWSGE